MPAPSIPACRACGRPYNGDDGCHRPAYPHAYLYGAEPWFTSGEFEPLDRCNDCGAPVGEAHHASCLTAECTICSDDAQANAQAALCPHAGEWGIP